MRKGDQLKATPPQALVPTQAKRRWPLRSTCAPASRSSVTTLPCRLNRSALSTPLLVLGSGQAPSGGIGKALHFVQSSQRQRKRSDDGLLRLPVSRALDPRNAVAVRRRLRLHAEPVVGERRRTSDKSFCAGGCLYRGAERWLRSVLLLLAGRTTQVPAAYLEASRAVEVWVLCMYLARYP